MPGTVLLLVIISKSYYFLGITEKLPYLKETGIDAVWLSPIYLSPMYDFGYDITDYREISPEYGTMDDFKRLLSEAKKLGE